MPDGDPSPLAQINYVWPPAQLMPTGPEMSRGVLPPDSFQFYDSSLLKDERLAMKVRPPTRTGRPVASTRLTPDVINAALKTLSTDSERKKALRGVCKCGRLTLTDKDTLCQACLDA